MGQLIYCNIIVNQLQYQLQIEGMCFTIALFPGTKLGNKANFTSDVISMENASDPYSVEPQLVMLFVETSPLLVKSL